MSTFVAMAFDSEADAFELRNKIIELQSEYVISLEDIVVATKKDNGKIKLHQAANLPAAGAASGSLWGMLIGMLFLNPLAGVLVGAGSGALAGAMSDIGISNDSMKEMGESFKKGEAMLFVLIRKATDDKVLAELDRYSGRVIKTSLSYDKEEQLRKVFEKADVTATVDDSIEMTSDKA